MMRIGIDLGGTKIEAIVLDEDGQVMFRQRVPTPAGDYSGTLACIANLVASAETQVSGRCSLGVGIPGAKSPDHGCVKNANSTCLIGHAIDRDLAALLGRPVRVANDADCFALSEATDGAGMHAASVFAIILGTGVGGGIVIDGKLISGPNAIAGEWGHNPLPWQGSCDLPLPPCYCGKRGCIETYLSGPGFSRSFREAGGPGIAAEEIVARAGAGDDLAEAVVERYMDRLARSLASVINVLDPELIVVGGGLSNIDTIYHEIPKRWGAFVFSDSVNTRIVKAQYGDSSGVRGAAWLW